MRFFKHIVIVTVVIVMVSASFSCGKTAASEITLTDQAGRTVMLPKPAERVVSCYYVTSYAMLSLGLGDRLVGIEKKADTRPIYQMAYPKLLSLPAVGSLKEIDSEKIASLSPDLVILPKKLADSASVLEALGISTLIVNPETDESLREMLSLIAAACGVGDRAENLIAFCYETFYGFTPSAESLETIG